MSGSGDQKELARKLSWAVTSTLGGLNRDLKGRVAAWAWRVAGHLVDTNASMRSQPAPTARHVFSEQTQTLLDTVPAERYTRGAGGRGSSWEAIDTCSPSFPLSAHPEHPNHVNSRRP